MTQDFISFASCHGLQIPRLICDDQWHRVPTDDKPHSKNGSYKHNGKYGILINFRTMTECASHPDRNSNEFSAEDRAKYAKEMAEVNRKAHEDREKKYSEARKNASKLLSECELDKHPYLEKKRFPDALALVSGNIMAIPMRDCLTNELNSIQSINHEGDKRFMYGGKAKGSVFVIGKKKDYENPIKILVEGYATGLSVYESIKGLCIPCEVIVCFAASNIIYVASKVSGKRIVFADNDVSETGQKAAKETGLPWTMAPEVGMDANDYHQKAGIFALQKLIRECIALL